MRIIHYQQSSAQRQRAFTMIEIAISLAIIGFALVAIIGVLPTGLTAQKENREETIINQDGPYFLEAIQNGGKGLEHLTNNFDAIGVVTLVNTNPTYSTNFKYYEDEVPAGTNIIGLLSLPFGKDFNGVNGQPVVRVIARVRALSGAAVETGGASKDFAFAYQLTTEVIPFIADANAMNAIGNVVAADPAVNEKYFAAMRNNLYEIKVTCNWPLLPDGRVGPNRKTFRALAGGTIDSQSLPPLSFFQPRSFTKPQP